MEPTIVFAWSICITSVIYHFILTVSHAEFPRHAASGIALPVPEDSYTGQRTKPECSRRHKPSQRSIIIVPIMMTVNLSDIVNHVLLAIDSCSNPDRRMQFGLVTSRMIREEGRVRVGA
jgi:hypothetical protein